MHELIETARYQDGAIRRPTLVSVRREPVRGQLSVLPTVPLIDRKIEVGVLRAALDDALAGSGRVVLLGGEPGIGKTHLARVIADQAATRGVPVWWGRGWEEGSAPAFWAWSTAFQRWADQVGQQAIDALTGPWRGDLGHVFQVLGDRAREVPPGTTWESDRFRIFDIVTRFLTAVAAPAGLVVVLDDIHWADRPSLRLLEYLAGGVRDTRILVVATYRDTEVQRDDPFCATLSRLAREPSTNRLPITGLSAEDCACWLAATGVAGDAGSLGEALHRETNGNPFFMGELVHLLASEGALDSGLDPRRLPHGLREVIARRLSRLGEGCRTVLEVASLLGGPVDARLLAEIIDEPSTADRLERAARDRILVEVDDRPCVYEFAHALIRRLLADELQPSARVAWHARIATVLERHAGASDGVSAELVRHFAAAGTPETLRKAFDHACQGAEEAARGHGWEEAVRLNEFALDVGALCGALDAEHAIDLKLALARALRGAGEIVAARARCAEVLAHCRRTPRPLALAMAALIHVGPSPQFGRVAPQDRAILEEACRGASALDDGARARLYARLAADIIGANETEQAERALALCEQAACAARRAGDVGALAMAVLGTGYATALRLRPRAGTPVAGDRRVGSLREVVAAAEAGGEHDSAAALRHLRAVGLFAAGDRERFSAEVDGLATAAAVSHAPHALWLADALAAMRAIVEGRFGQAQELMQRALSTGQRMQLTNAVGQYVSQRIILHLVQGRLAEIAAEIEAFVEDHPTGHWWRPVCALAHLAGGDVVGASNEFQTLLAAGFGPAESGILSRCYLAALGQLCVELGDRASAPALYERVALQADAWSVDGCQTLGPWELVLGALASLCDRPADAARHFEKALVQARRMRARPFVARAQALLAQALLSSGPRRTADVRVQPMLDEAERTAAELGLVDVRARVEQLRAMLDSRRAGTPTAFRWEGEVWTLAFGGREIFIRDGKGPCYLATLLAAPGQAFHVLDLAARVPAAAPETISIAADGLSVGGLGIAIEDGPDGRAAREYRAHVEELRAEIAEAEEFGDSGRAEQLRGELEFLVAQLAQRFGSRARTRSAAETARKAVTKVIRAQIGKLLDAHPPLGEHLRAAVRMGTFCTYEPGTPTIWEVSAVNRARPHS